MPSHGRSALVGEGQIETFSGGVFAINQVPMAA